MLDRNPPGTFGVRVWVLAASIFAAAYLVWTVLAGAFEAFLLLFTAILLAAGLRPIVERLSKRMPFGAAVSLAFGALLIVGTLLVVLLNAPIASELIKLIKSLPDIITALQDRLAALQRFIKSDQFVQQIVSMLSSNAGGAINLIGSHLLAGPTFVGKAIGNLLIILLLALGWMLAEDELAQFVLSLFPPGVCQDWREAFILIGQRLSAYVQGVVINGAIVGIVMGIALAVLGVPYSLLLAFIIALAQAIPMVGAVISGIVVLLAALASVGWVKMLIVIGIFAVVQVIDQNVLSPIIFGQRVQMNFLLIIFSTVVGGLLLGIAGAFLAVPAAVVLQVILVQIVAPAIRRANGVTPDGAVLPVESAETRN
ncbi:MAG: AI-2E family transporter [Candidatus Cybelea sp.]